MARLETRARAGRSASYRVRWAFGGDRRVGARSGSELFTTLAGAQSFKTLVETCGEQWPAGWLDGCAHNDAQDTQPGIRNGSGADWRNDDGRAMRCGLCGLAMPVGQWGYADGPLCRPADHRRQDCYLLWVTHGARPGRQLTTSNAATPRPSHGHGQPISA